MSNQLPEIDNKCHKKLNQSSSYFVIFQVPKLFWQPSLCVQTVFITINFINLRDSSEVSIEFAAANEPNAMQIDSELCGREECKGRGEKGEGG